VRLHKQQAPPLAPKPVSGLPRDIEVALGVLEKASRARLGPAGAELLKRLKRIADALH
jgi:hypothetical protein